MDELTRLVDTDGARRVLQGRAAVREKRWATVPGFERAADGPVDGGDASLERWHGGTRDGGRVRAFFVAIEVITEEDAVGVGCTGAVRSVLCLLALDAGLGAQRVTLALRQIIVPATAVHQRRHRQRAAAEKPRPSQEPSHTPMLYRHPGTGKRAPGEWNERCTSMCNMDHSSGKSASFLAGAAPRRHPAAHLWSAVHAPPFQRGASRLSALVAVAASLVVFPAGATTTSEWNTSAPLPEEPVPELAVGGVRAAPVVFDVALRAGLGRTTLSEDGEAQAQLDTGCTDLSLAIGTFIGPMLKIGYEVTLGNRRVLGHEMLTDTPWLYAPIEGDTWMLLPVGGYFELYPIPDVDVFIGAHVGVGSFWPEEYMTGGNIELAATAAAEIGYEHDWGDGARWALAVRYAATGMGRSYIDENYTTTQNADELSLSARVSLY